jgi:nucleoside-diphosphate kinase
MGGELPGLERTLIVIKPDGVARSLVGQVISRFEAKGFKIVKMKMLTFSRDLAANFYSPHEGKPFFGDLLNFIVSGPTVAAVLEGANAIEVVRRMIGATKSFEAAAGTIRGDFGLGYTDNVIHASDSRESFERESKVLFLD